MEALLQFIRQADTAQIDIILQVTLSRWQELYPDWEISTLRLDRRKDRNTQLEQTITILNNLKDLG